MSYLLIANVVQEQKMIIILFKLYFSVLDDEILKISYFLCKNR